MTVGEYLELIREAHLSQGALSGQRAVLTTTTAKRIRARMVADLKEGAVLPPIVLGAVLDNSGFSALPRHTDNLFDILPKSGHQDLAIIDGMQRTAALLEAAGEKPAVNQTKLRVEFWLTKNVRAMIYRMLVLNTGQVPWTMSRQLSVVFAPLLKEIQVNVPELDKLSSPDKPGRRVAAAQFSTDAVVELYIAFSLRKTAVDTKEAVSDEFSRLDFVENLSEPEFQDQFYQALSMLTKLDLAFSTYEGEATGRFSKGRNIFDSQPARTGFIVAIATAVLGRPGASRSPEQRAEKIKTLDKQLDKLLHRIQHFNNEELAAFLKLDVLSEVLDRRSGQVGRYERSVFAEAFKVLIEVEFELDDLEQCWRAS